MVIDMNKSRLETVEQIREFLAGTADFAFAVPTDKAKLRSASFAPIAMAAQQDWGVTSQGQRH